MCQDSPLSSSPYPCVILSALLSHPWPYQWSHQQLFLALISHVFYFSFIDEETYCLFYYNGHAVGHSENIYLAPVEAYLGRHSINIKRKVFSFFIFSGSLTFVKRERKRHKVLLVIYLIHGIIVLCLDEHDPTPLCQTLLHHAHVESVIADKDPLLGCY